MKNLFIGLTFLLIPFLIFGQEELEKGYYPFIKYQENHIFLGKASALDYFFKNMDSLAKGEEKQVNIVQIGDSHIQADFFSNHLRKQSQNTFHLGNGGKGFIFPYRLAKTNNPNSYKVSYTGTWDGKRIVGSSQYNWGVAGIVATTHQSSATFSIKLNTDKDTSITYSTNKIRVYYPTKDRTSFEICIKNHGNIIKGNIDTVGGFITFELPELVDEVNFVFQKTASNQTHFHVEGILLTNDESGIVYHSIGINGAQFRSFLKCPKFVEQLKTLNPHLIILSLGTNDVYGPNAVNEADFKHTVEQIIYWIRQASPNASILLTSPADNLYKRSHKNHNNAKVGEFFKELAVKHNLAVWDLYTVMGGLSSIRQWEKNGLAQSDYVHFSAKGYLLQGELLYQALIMDTYFGKHQQILTSKPE